MGKNWRGGRGGGGGGNGGRGSNDFASVRGHGFILGTCDAARERETSKEVVNLLMQAIEELGLSSTHITTQKQETSNDSSDAALPSSIGDMLAQELSSVRSQSHKESQTVVSINTNVKGIVLAKIMMPDLCPVTLVKAIFQRVQREKQPISRHVVRLIPLQYSFFPNQEELKINIAELILAIFDYKTPENEGTDITSKVPGGADESMDAGKLEEENEDIRESKKRSISEESGVDVAKRLCTDEGVIATTNNISDAIPNTSQDKEDFRSTTESALVVSATPTVLPAFVPTSSTSLLSHPKRTFAVSFKARNHDSLTRAMVQTLLESKMPPWARFSKHHFELGCVSCLSYVAGDDDMPPKFVKQYMAFLVCSSRYPTFLCTNVHVVEWDVEGIFVVEALKNLGGIAYITEYEKYEEFNLRKYQSRCCEVECAPVQSNTVCTSAETVAVETEEV